MANEHQSVERLNSGEIVLSPMNNIEAEYIGLYLASISPWSDYDYPAEKLVKFLQWEDPTTFQYTIKYQENLAGTIVIRIPWLQGPYIQLLGLKTELHNKGIGTQVMDWAIQKSKETSARNLWVVASEFNQKAVRFYERHGFEKAAQFDELVKDDLNEILFRKKLFKNSEHQE